MPDTPGSGPPDPERTFSLAVIEDVVLTTLAAAEIRRDDCFLSAAEAWAEIEAKLLALPRA